MSLVKSVNWTILIGFFLIVAVFGGGAYLFLSKNDMIPTTPLSEVDLADGTLPGEGDVVLAEDQNAGWDINVSVIKLQKPGFVVLHRANDLGKPGAILGASTLLDGELSDFALRLDAPAYDNDTLFAMLHYDDGDGTFDSELDSPVLDALENPVMIEFKALPAGYETPNVEEESL